MSDYATLQQFKDHLGTRVYAQVSDRVEMATPNDTTGQTILDNAEAWLNGELAVRYQVPIDASGNATLASILRYHTLIAAAYNGYANHPTLRGQVPEGVKRTFELTVAWLKSVKDGEPLPGAPPTSTTSETIARRGGDDRKFTSDIY